MPQTRSVVLSVILLSSAAFSPRLSSARCSWKDVSSLNQHCEQQPGGVGDLDCFGRYDTFSTRCVWKAGAHTSKTTYTLILRQQSRNYCKMLKDITELSAEFKPYAAHNMTVEVLEKMRCGPPRHVTFHRRSGRLDVGVSWQTVDESPVRSFHVRYKAAGSRTWSESQSRDGKRCSVENVTSSLVYTAQVRCVTNDKCSQCPWSDAYMVPSELTTHPVLSRLQERPLTGQRGQRLLSLAWTFPAEELHDGYLVTVGKESGEDLSEQVNTTQPEVQLILSYSAYWVNVSAFNNASVSPAASRAVPRHAHTDDGGAKLNVTVHSRTSFSISWTEDLSRTYVCFCVEWMKKQHKAVSLSFYQDANNSKTFPRLSEPLEPHRRYNISLHTRTERQTCNLKHINNTERTYATTQFYSEEGTPVSAPTNVGSYNVTQDSMVLQWSSIPEDDLRGFLRGYVIRYVPSQHGGAHAGRNVTVGPQVNRYKLKGLKSGTIYQVQIAGLTRAGPGELSALCLFKTNHEAYFSTTIMITAFAVVALLVIFGSPLIKRVKITLWPSIPNPGKSDAMQKTERVSELPINTLEVEEWDTENLQIVEEQLVTPMSTPPSMLHLLHHSEDDSCQGDNDDDTGGDKLPAVTTDTFSDVQRTNLQTSTLALSSGYTTMEMFQQGALAQAAH